MDRKWIREKIKRLAREQYLSDTDAAFVSGNLTTQYLDPSRQPLGETMLLTSSDGSPLMIVGLNRIGDGSVAGK